DLSLKKIRYRIIYTMKKLSNKIIFSALLLFLLMPLFIQADVKFENPINATSVQAVISAIGIWLYGIAFALVPIMILIGAFYLLTAAGDPEKINTGRKIITWTIIGLAIVIISTGISELIKNLLETTP
ncbi:MAG: hypothetical protein AUK07_01500, partial [Parcubacteria group bacterium CG2_30_36_21]